MTQLTTATTEQFDDDMPTIRTHHEKYVEEAIKSLMAMESQCTDLVWYSRSQPSSDTEYWNSVPEDIRIGALNSQAKVEEKYVEEIEALKGPDGTWNHGFLSGQLASIRYILTALSEDVSTADDEFPMLDT